MFLRKCLQNLPFYSIPIITGTAVEGFGVRQFGVPVLVLMYEVLNKLLNLLRSYLAWISLSIK